MILIFGWWDVVIIVGRLRCFVGSIIISWACSHLKFNGCSRAGQDVTSRNASSLPAWTSSSWLRPTWSMTGRLIISCWTLTELLCAATQRLTILPLLLEFSHDFSLVLMHLWVSVLFGWQAKTTWSQRTAWADGTESFTRDFDQHGLEQTLKTASSNQQVHNTEAASGVCLWRAALSTNQPQTGKHHLGLLLLDGTSNIKCSTNRKTIKMKKKRSDLMIYL